MRLKLSITLLVKAKTTVFETVIFIILPVDWTVLIFIRLALVNCETNVVLTFDFIHGIITSDHSNNCYFVYYFSVQQLIMGYKLLLTSESEANKVLNSLPQRRRSLGSSRV